ncbi:uncharacterized protein LOC116192523 isoform X1 [Punica granatum]|uniref:Uncharacterized protein LOC116192523 isoform X1 n=2 Tax=Punica granatum TaxID=22663 RepID=A0A6P8C6Z3_PUNGR|nr:uncharacterized protein LOC116192523 isoform X1 [Punica granatum]XP_031376953.1 uncharacterized protein LOC116192523 isoform X1 [Punica granatum]PKI47668.1 hypothetical protein CRG98_031954 [Punica granatum]
MKEEDISSGGTNNDAFTLARSSPAASSAGASSPAVLVNAGSVEWLGHGQPSKAGSVSGVGPHPPRPSTSTNAASSTVGSFQASCRPWERGDLLRRLATFSPSNWFAKPKRASSLACARRGWINVDWDKIECESCGASLRYNSKAPSEADAADEDFAELLDGGHRVGCPWRENSCPESLVQFPPAPLSALIGGYKDRCDGLLQFSVLPVVSAVVVEQMQVSRGPQIERLLSNSQTYVTGELGFKAEYVAGVEPLWDESLTAYFRAQKLISLCGWESRWLPDIQDCEEHSAQSARNGYSSGPVKNQSRLQDPGPSRKAFSSSANKDCGQDEAPGSEFKCESRSPLLDCSLCGATVRIWDFSTVSRPARFAQNGIDLPETGKKLPLTRGISAASGISGWIGTDGVDKDRADDHDEAATPGKRRFAAHTGVDLNLTMAGGLSSTQLNMTALSQQQRDADLGRDLKVGQPSGSEVGDRAASYESRGPGTRKRSADEGGSTVDRPHLRMHQADSFEGTVIDRDGDEVNDSRQYSAGPSKRARSSDALEAYHSSYRRDSSDAGPSRPMAFEMEADVNRGDAFDQGNDQLVGFPYTRDSTHVSSVIAMDTFCHSADDDSLESVENFPVDTDDVNFPSASTYANPDLNDASDLNYSNQAQQSACFQPVAARLGEAGVSSTIDGEEVVNTEALTTQVRDGISFGISGGSVGMGASYEAEIHGTDASVHRSDSVVGDAEPIAEVIENQGQTGEFAPEVGNTDDFVPEEMDREDPHGDSQDVVSQSMGRADSGSKIVGSAKAESIESGEKTRNMNLSVQDTVAHPSLSCNAIVFSGYEASKDEVSQAQKASPTHEGCFLESGYDTTNGIGPPVGESNYDEGVEFDPIKHHNAFCPWVNGNVAAAGSTSDGASSSSGASAAAFCGWQLTLDALDAFQTLGNVPIQTVESESAASRHKDDRLPPSRNLLACHSFSRSRGQN